jgi:hypothetical protein
LRAQSCPLLQQQHLHPTWSPGCTSLPFTRNPHYLISHPFFVSLLLPPMTVTSALISSPLSLQTYTHLLQVAQITSAVPQPNSAKLLKMQADLGEGDTRQIMAGLQQFLKPEDLQVGALRMASILNGILCCLKLFVEDIGEPNNDFIVLAWRWIAHLKGSHRRASGRCTRQLPPIASGLAPPPLLARF